MGMLVGGVLALIAVGGLLIAAVAVFGQQTAPLPSATPSSTALAVPTPDAGRRTDYLIIVGAETDACIRSTLHGALARGYDTILVSDAHTATDKTSWGAPPPDQVIAHTNLYWTYQTAPGRTAETVETKTVDFSGSS